MVCYNNNHVLSRQKNKSIATVPKKDLFIVLPLLGSQSEVLARRASCGFKAPVQAKKLLYLTMVRSKLKVGVPVWSSHRKENLMKIEGVQRRATRFILRSDIGYKDRLSACGLMPLSLRFDVPFL